MAAASYRVGHGCHCRARHVSLLCVCLSVQSCRLSRVVCCALRTALLPTPAAHSRLSWVAMVVYVNVTADALSFLHPVSVSSDIWLCTLSQPSSMSAQWNVPTSAPLTWPSAMLVSLKLPPMCLHLHCLWFGWHCVCTQLFSKRIVIYCGA